MRIALLDPRLHVCLECTRGFVFDGTELWLPAVSCPGSEVVLTYGVAMGSCSCDLARSNPRPVGWIAENPAILAIWAEKFRDIHAAIPEVRQGVWWDCTRKKGNA